MEMRKTCVPAVLWDPNCLYCHQFKWKCTPVSFVPFIGLLIAFFPGTHLPSSVQSYKFTSFTKAKCNWHNNYSPPPLIVKQLLHCLRRKRRPQFVPAFQNFISILILLFERKLVFKQHKAVSTLSPPWGIGIDGVPGGTGAAGGACSSLSSPRHLCLGTDRWAHKRKLFVGITEEHSLIISQDKKSWRQGWRKMRPHQ